MAAFNFVYQAVEKGRMARSRITRTDAESKAQYLQPSRSSLFCKLEVTVFFLVMSLVNAKE